MDTNESLNLLNYYLSKEGEKRELVIAGGAALNMLGVSDRYTMDVDVVAPHIDKTLKEVSIKVSHQAGLDSEWLNGGVSIFKNIIPDGWEKRINVVFSQSHLKVWSLSRLDLACMKFYSVFDRGQVDISDLSLFAFDESELEEIFYHLTNGIPHLANSKDWERDVRELVEHIKESL